MKKRIILGSIVLILITATSCNINTDNNESNISDSQTQSIDTSSTLSQPQSSPETLSKPESENNQDSEIDYMQVLKNFRWFLNDEWDNPQEIDKYHFAMWYNNFLFEDQDHNMDMSKYYIEGVGPYFSSEELEPVVKEYFGIESEELRKNDFYNNGKYSISNDIGSVPFYKMKINSVEKFNDITNIYFTLTVDNGVDDIFNIDKVLTISNDEIPRYISIKNSK